LQSRTTLIKRKESGMKRFLKLIHEISPKQDWLIAAVLRLIAVVIEVMIVIAVIGIVFSLFASAVQR
jgi:hypothetical protein